MKKIAICIPTYNRAEVLQDTFSYELDACRDLGIDIWVYDSSTDGQTRELIESLKDYNNLYYVSVDSSVTLDEKVVMIYQSYERTQKYDYLWLVGDSVSFSRDILVKIRDAAESDPTMIFINNEDLQHLGNKEYHDVHTIFCELFWKSTLWGSIIIKASLYDDIEWSPYIEKFVGTDQISVGLHWYRLADVQDFRAVLFSVRKGIDLRKSPLKKFAWWKETEHGGETQYRVWAEGLIDVVYNLPYSQEELEAALETQRVYMKNFYWLNLCRSRKDKVYNLDILKKYGRGIGILSKYPYFLLWIIAVTPVLPMKVIVRVADKFCMR